MNGGTTNAHDENDRNQDSGGSPPRLHSVKQVLAAGYPNWLVKHFLEADSFAMFYGPPESAKSFLALDLAFHVATGRDWQGRKVRKRTVVYVAAEGKKGIRQRVEAFLKFHGWAAPENLFFLLQSVQLKPPTDLGKLVAAINGLKLQEAPGLIVIDTLARCFSGDENSTEHMNAAIRELDKFRASFPGVTVLLVHHTNKKGEHYRGSSALHGALDSMTLVKKSGDTVLVANDKQKDAARHGPMSFTLKQVQLVAADEDGDPITSCVLVSGAASESGWLDSLSPAQKQAFLALHECGRGAVPNAVWQAKATASGMSLSTFEKAKKHLANLEWIEGEGEGRSRRWRLTSFGLMYATMGTTEGQAVGEASTKRGPSESPRKPDAIPSHGEASPSKTVVHDSVDEVSASDSGDEEDPEPWHLPDDFPTDDSCSSGDDSDTAEIGSMSLSGEEKRS